MQCDSPVDCHSRDRCRIACIKSIWQFAGLQTALRPRARLQYFCSAKMQANASGSPKSSREAAFFACPMEIRRLAMRQSGGLSLARPMQDCLHQKHLALCRIANSIAPPSATLIFLQCKNAGERKRVTKKVRESVDSRTFSFIFNSKNPHFESAFFRVSNPLVTAKLPFIKGSPLLFSCVADVGKAADKPRGILN